jgi:hypothetical protein
LSLWVAELCSRLTSAFRVGSLVICHCIRTSFFRLFHPECLLVSGPVGRYVDDVREWKLLEPSERRRRSSQHTCQ